MLLLRLLAVEPTDSEPQLTRTRPYQRDSDRNGRDSDRSAVAFTGSGLVQTEFPIVDDVPRLAPSAPIENAKQRAKSPNSWPGCLNAFYYTHSLFIVQGAGCAKN